VVTAAVKGGDGSVQQLQGVVQSAVDGLEFSGIPGDAGLLENLSVTSDEPEGFAVGGQGPVGVGVGEGPSGPGQG
jgi:hypothetical protein